MASEVIAFDKDGTLIDFDSFWISISVMAIRDVLKIFGAERLDVDEILASLGVKDGKTDIDGILCHGTYAQIGEKIGGFLRSAGCTEPREEIVAAVIEAYNENMESGEVKPTCENIREVLLKLKNGGRRLIVVTTDNLEITSMCLEKLDIKDLFDKIYTDDGKTPVKPNPQCIFDYCQGEGIDKDKVIMVGDTMTDVNFAKNAGIRIISVAADEENRKRLAPYADAVIPDISHIFEIAEV